MLNEDDLNQIQALIKEDSEAREKSFQETITGVMTRIMREPGNKDKTLDSRLTKIEDGLQTLSKVANPESFSHLVREQINAAFEELADEETTPAPASNSTPASISPPPESINQNQMNNQGDGRAITDLKKQMAEQARASEAYKAQVDQLTTALNEERKTRESLAEQARVSGMREELLREMRGKVSPNTETQMLTLMDADGLLVEENETNRYLVKVLDSATGLPTNVTIDKALPRLLQDKYPYFVPKRDGTGTGSSGAGDGNSRQPVAGKVFQGGNREPSDAELMRIMDDPKALDGMFAELSRL